MTITAEHFEQRTGHPPKNDDLERANCPRAGEVGHTCCGWDTAADLPEFMTMARLRRQSEEVDQ